MISKPIFNVGIIGCGEVAQVIHIPVLNQLDERFRITYLCSASANALEWCSKRTLNNTPSCTSNTATLCSSPDVDIVFVLSSDELHTRHTLLALVNNKHVFVEKPLAISLADAHSIVEAEKKSSGKVFVGYMRRYAAGFQEAQEEIKRLGSILYVRVRDIIGPNETFVEQSSTFPERFSDYPSGETQKRAELLTKILQQALEVECGIKITPEIITKYQNLYGLGSHDLSAMRELLGTPEGVVGASLRKEFWNVLFKFPDYTLSYESGFYNVPSFDAHIEVYGEDKSVLIQWDTPYIRGLPVTITIKERVDGGGFAETLIRKTYEDPFIRELKELHAELLEGRSAKTSAEDSVKDIMIWQMVIRSAQDLRVGDLVD